MGRLSDSSRATPSPLFVTTIIRHEKIDGWMEAMTMEFLVTDEKGFESLHSGDRVTATVMVGKQKFWISEIHREF
jgi:Cu/Ag efflux protein CusF